MKPKAQIEYKPLGALRELPGNPRTIKKDQFEKLKTSLQNNADYFEARPLILSDRTGELVILAGNQRYKAAKAIGLEQVPTITLHGFVYDTIKAFEDAGLRYYNHAILANNANCGLRVRGHMLSRKLVHAHQDALVFTKGEPDSSDYIFLDPEALLKRMQEERKLVPQNEDILIFTNAQSNEALRENFEEIGGGTNA